MEGKGNNKMAAKRTKHKGRVQGSMKTNANEKGNTKLICMDIKSKIRRKKERTNLIVSREQIKKEVRNNSERKGRSQIGKEARSKCERRGRKTFGKYVKS